MVIRLDPGYDIPIDTLLYTAPQPDTQAAKIDEQAATIATLREYYEATEAVQEIGVSKASGAMWHRLNHARLALAATEQK